MCQVSCHISQRIISLTSAQVWYSGRLMQQANIIHCHCKTFCSNVNLQGYQAYASQGEQRGSPTQSQGPSSPHSLLPQGRGSIVYGTSGGYQQQDQSLYTAQGVSGLYALCPLILQVNVLQPSNQVCLQQPLFAYIGLHAALHTQLLSAASTDATLPCRGCSRLRGLHLAVA